ncbi:lysophosphatidylserine lipase ABHD12 [Nematolebias whitei]|uniref:lysophosphatidylserine lipase ABHD12 n=1 Tax=Nematolebias whitei TaxID=451745 RepID=UPI00189831E5|nr:lysophosphatidylserine lipase ABHD12 [Nematolebias whitei]
MKRRVVKQINPSPDTRETRRAAKKEGMLCRRWMKWGLLAAAVCVLVPVTLKWAPELIQHFVHVHRVRVPFFVDLSRPADFSQNHTINMYLTSEEGISLGVWHTVPEGRWKEAQGKELLWYQNSLNDGSPVFIYFHGNTMNRAAPHRVGVAKLLSALGYHVLVPDYRGFGDSTGEPTLSGLSADAVYLYNWVKARCGDSLLVLWGHSLGTGVAIHSAVKLLEQGVVLDGVVLEGTVNTDRQSSQGHHPFFWYYWKFPGMGYLFPEPWAENKFSFSTEQHLKEMRSPILFLYSEDDPFVPNEVARQTYEVAATAQSKEKVQLVTFDASRGYLHNGLYRDPKTPGVLKDFVQSLLQWRNS